MPFQGASFPSKEAPIDPSTGLFGWRLLRWFNDLRASIDATTTLVPDGRVQITGRTSAIGATAIPTAALAEGLYRVDWNAQVVTPAGVSSSVQVTVTWTRNGVTQTFTGVLKNGNATTTYESSTVPLIHIDAATPVSYAVAYASNPAAAMVYDLDLLLNVVSLD